MQIQEPFGNDGFKVLIALSFYYCFSLVGMVINSLFAKDWFYNLVSEESGSSNIFYSLYLYYTKKQYFCAGELAEWSNAAVLKTVVP